MTALNTLLILLTAVCIPGLINRTRAVLAGRRGIRFAQHLYDVRLLLRKGAVYSTTASALFRAVPSVYLGSAIVAALFIPVGELKSLLSFDGDIVCFAYLMALGRFALILGAAKPSTARWSNRRSCSRPARWPCWRATRRSPGSSPKRRRATCS